MKSDSTNTNQRNKKFLQTRQLVIIGMFSALSYILMLIHFPIKYLGFLELEVSDIPAIVACAGFGPISGVLIELIKNLLKALTMSTTGGTGELANFLVSIGYILPFGILYHKLSGKWKNLIACTAGTIGMVFMGIIVNSFITVPLYASLFGGEEAVIGVCATFIPAIHNVATVVILGITPFNIFKGILISIIGVLCAKAFAKVLKG